MKEAILFNYGGTHVTVDGYRATNFSYLTPDYDLEATLQRYDMEQNGLRAQVFRDAAGVSETVTKEMMSELKHFDKRLAEIVALDDRNFLSGLGEKTINELGIDKVKLAIGRMAFANQNNGSLLNDTIENQYFENYVGH